MKKERLLTYLWDHQGRLIDYIWFLIQCIIITCFLFYPGVNVLSVLLLAYINYRMDWFDAPVTACMELCYSIMSTSWLIFVLFMLKGSKFDGGIFVNFVMGVPVLINYNIAIRDIRKLDLTYLLRWNGVNSKFKVSKPLVICSIVAMIELSILVFSFCEDLIGVVLIVALMLVVGLRLVVRNIYFQRIICLLLLLVFPVAACASILSFEFDEYFRYMMLIAPIHITMSSFDFVYTFYEDKR